MVKMTADAMGDHCPIPVVKTKKALGKLQGAGQIEVLVDNETAMKNVMKMAKSSGASAESEKISDRESDDYGRREERGCIRKRSKRTDRRKRKPGAGRRRGERSRRIGSQSGSRKWK